MADVSTETIHVVDEGHGGGSAGMPQLDPASFASQLFWLTVIFAALYVIMSRNVIPRIRAVMEKRQSQISHDLDSAEKAQEEAQRAKENYEKELVSAKAKASSLILETQQQIERNSVQTHHKLDQKLALQFVDAEKDIIEQTEKSKQEVTPVIQELATDIVETLIKVKPAPKKVEAVVDQVIKGTK
ncbi:MAG: hypothetical protein MRY32_07710 [Rickettsiales bacterium]|nr:hypothetical protein [Rickettsiales bacterium]